MVLRNKCGTPLVDLHFNFVVTQVRLCYVDSVGRCLPLSAVPSIMTEFTTHVTTDRCGGYLFVGLLGFGRILYRIFCDGDVDFIGDVCCHYRYACSLEGLLIGPL